MEDFELYADEEEEAAESEGANRTFIILVGALGGLLALSVCAFIVWAFWLSPQRQAAIETQNQLIMATNTAIAAQELGEPETEETLETEEAAAEEEETAATEPEGATETPQPPPTEKPPTPSAATETPAEVAEAKTPTASPSPTRRPTATPRASSSDVPETGIGVVGASALAVGLMFLLIVVRRMRRAL